MNPILNLAIFLIAWITTVVLRAAFFVRRFLSGKLMLECDK